MSHIATTRNAGLFTIAGAVLWLVRLPSFELGLISGQPHDEPRIDVVVVALPFAAILGLALITAGIATYAAVERHRGPAIGATVMIAALATLGLAFTTSSDSMPQQAFAFATFALGWLVLALTARSGMAVVAAGAMAAFALGLVPNSLLSDAYILRDVAPPAFGIAVLGFATRFVTDGSTNKIQIGPAAA